MDNIFITSEFYRSSTSSTQTEYYNPKTRIAAVMGDAPGEAYYVWIAAPPEDGRGPNPKTHLVEWIPRSGKLTRHKAGDEVPADVQKVDGIGFIRPKIIAEEFLIDPSTTSVTSNSDPPSGPNQHKVYPGRKSIDPMDRTGLDFDLITGDVMLKGPRGSALKVTEDGIHMTKPVKTLDMNDRGWSSDNFLSDFLPSFPTFPVGMERLPNLQLMGNIFGKIGAVMGAISKLKGLLK